MTLSEFKAWFEGFSENMDGPPDDAKWEKIKAKIAKIDGAPISYPVYIRDWYPRYLDRYPYWVGGTTGYVGAVAQAGQNANFTAAANGYSESQSMLVGNAEASGFNSHEAMYLAGKAEAAN